MIWESFIQQYYASHSSGAGVRLIDEPPIQGEQFSFFPTESDQIQSIEEAESAAKAPFAFSIPQKDIDQILRFGSNTENSRMRVTTEFRKQKSREGIAAFLKQEYHGGYGIKGRDGDVSAWYAEDGIHLSMGLGAKDVSYAQILSWEDATARMEEMLDAGTFATNVELAEAPGFERRQMAQTLWYLRHDMSEEATGRGFLPTMKAIRGSNAPDETQSLAELLKDPAHVDGIIAELEAFAEAHAQDKELMRFQFYKPSIVLGQLRELTLPRREYASSLAELPKVETFITEDEISQVLAGGSNVEGSKGRIYAYFTANHTLKEQITFLKEEYGIGGHSHGVSGADGSFEDHSGKGIRLQKRGCVDVELSWNKVAKRVQTLIREDKYLTPEEKAQFQHNTRRNSLYDTYNDVKQAHPDDMVLFQVGDFFELYGEDARQASELLGLHLASRNIPGVGRVDMCGVPAHTLEGYVEKLRAQFDVTVSAVPEGGKERGAYTLRAFARETEHAADTPEVESETAQERETEQPQPTVAELLDQYKPIVTAAVTEDRPYRNACGNSDRENAAIECNAAVRRAVLNSGDLELIRAFSDVPEFRQRLHREVFDETYPQLYALLRPLSQDDIDNALRAWNGDMDSKRAVVRYMEAHARDRNTAAWLSREYGGGDSKAAFPVRAGSPESVALPWAKVQRRIAQLIQKDAFFTEEERDNFEDIDPVAIRERLESGDPSPFVAQVMADLEQIAARNEVTPYERFTVVETDEGYGIWDDLHDGLYVDEDGVTADFDSEWVAEDYLKELREKVSRQESEEWRYVEHSKNAPETEELKEKPEQADTSPSEPIEAAEMEPVPQIQNDSDLVGMELTIDGRHFVVDEITGDRASLRDITFQNGTGFPIFRNESVQTVRDILYPEQRSVQHVNLTAQVTDAQLERMRQQLNAAGIDYLVTRAGYNSNSISFSSQYYREVQAMLDALAEEPEQSVPGMKSETEAVYPGDKTGLPYDIVVERLRTEPEHTPPTPDRPNEENEVLDANPISVQVDGEWRTFPNRDAAEDAMYADFKDRTRRDAQNFRITDDNLGVGGAKTKYRANINAITLLKHLESEGMQASPEQQEVLSRYVGWGGLPDAFDPDKPNWAAEYEELKRLLTPAEYEAAHASTLNAHFTCPTVIKAIYEAVGNMGFRTGNILDKMTIRLIQVNDSRTYGKVA